MTLRLPLLFTSCAIAITVSPCRGQRPPSSSEVTKLLKAFYALDHRVAADHTRQHAILAKLDKVRPLTERREGDWRKRLMKAQKKRRRIEKKGESWFWEKDKRGRYIVGGQTRKPKGLLIGLHGGGLGSGDAGSAFGTYQTAAKKLGWLLISPEVLVKSEHGWTTDGTEEFVLELIDAALRTWKIDPDHVFLAGHSMGGYGSWTLGAHHADRFAALAPSAGAPTPIKNLKHEIIDVEEGVIHSLRNVGMIIFQSLDDPQVPPGPNQMATQLLAQAKKKWGGYDFEYWEVNGHGHGMPRGGAGAILDKIKAKKRNPVPDRITWQPVLEWKRQFYWLYWRKPQIDALLVVDRDREKNEIRVQCDKDCSGLQILLDDRLVDLSKEVCVIVNDKEVFRGTLERRLATLVLTSLYFDSKSMFSVKVVIP